MVEVSAEALAEKVGRGVGTVSVTTWPYAGVDILACHARRTVAGGW
jgi:hypothetical protein